MRTLDAQGDPLRLMASQFSQQSDVMRTYCYQFKNNLQKITQGHDGWTGRGAQAYLAQGNVLIGKMEQAIPAFQMASSALYQLAENADLIQMMKQRIEQIRSQLVYQLQSNQSQATYSSTNNAPDLYQMESEIQYLERQIEEDSARYDKEATYQFQMITNMAPQVHALQQEMQAATMIYGPSLDPGFVPILVKANVGTLTGRKKIDYLNDIILMNREVDEYYKTHPNATGPNGESAAEMQQLVRGNQDEARREGGTIGVPIVFMHGLNGDKGTFEKMVSESGGFSKIYTFKKDGTVVIEDGPNQDADQPLIQFVFEDGAMHYQDQVNAFSKMVGEMKSDNDCQYFMVAAHSMGGVITTKYIEDTGGDDILRLATLGSPILGSDDDRAVHKGVHWMPAIGPLTSGIKAGVSIIDYAKPAIPELEKGSKANQKIYDNRGEFNQNIEVFSGGGDGWGVLGDQVVMPNSAFGLKFFANPDKFHTKMYPNDTHGELHDNDDEINDTMNFLKYGEISNGK